MKIIRVISSILKRFFKNNHLPSDYNAKEYWFKRHSQFNYESLKGVGRIEQTEAQNTAWYRSAGIIFDHVFSQVDLKNDSRILEIGIGTGFYTKKIFQSGFKNYVGLDIVSNHFEHMKTIFPDTFKFYEHDVGVTHLGYGSVDCVVMIDVTQHIVNDEKLAFCLRNISDSLVPGGCFIVTDELNNMHFSFYEKSRDLNFYRKHLREMNLFIEPLQFRDKFIFSFKKNI
jgi:SAM-dependent methyltransferase